MAEKRDSNCDSPAADGQAASVMNEQGGSPYLLICEHATNYIPEKFSRLGLTEVELATHIAWDPGASEVAHRMSAALDATLVEACFSRLLIDCNRPLSAPDLIPQISELTFVPGNQGLSEAGRQERILLSHQPFHTKVEQVIEARKQRGQESRLITIHSFTPVYKDVERVWEIGIIHDADDRLSAKIITGLRKDAESSGIHVGVNEPYSPDDRVYYTVERHARQRGDLCAMVEIRNNEIADAAGQSRWAKLLTAILQDIDAA